MLISWSIWLSVLFQLASASHNETEFASCQCSDVSEPVCGSDGVTYDSKCHLECQQKNSTDVSVQYEGTCCPQVVCQDIKDPVCDSQGMTHGNECRFNAAECVRRKTENVTVTIQYKGHCDECVQVCDELPLPICDERNETHLSLCKLDEFNCRLKALGHPPRRVKHVGKCQRIEKTPIVAAGARTAPDSEELRSNFPERSKSALGGGVDVYGSEEDLDVFANGEGVSEKEASRNVPDQRTDNKLTSQGTKSASTEESQSPKKENGTDEEKAPVCSAELCTKQKDPLCDNFNKTHLNPCLFQFAACKSLRQLGVHLKIAYKGECSKPRLTIRREQAKGCSKCATEEEVVPVCDNFNHTHQSICLFSNWNCERRRANLEQRVLVHVGPCHAGSPLFNLKEEVCPNKCSRDYRPVCDSHGTTHPNLCTFQMYNCKARKSNVDDVAFLTTLHECKDVASKSATNEKVFHAMEPKRKGKNETFECPEPHCDNVRSPVCDSEGHVYKNECLFAWERCLAAQQGRTLRIVPDESCNASNCRLTNAENCTNDYDPVCGSDFVTYPNFCLYQKAQCAEHRLEVLFKGECSACLVKPCPHLEPESDDDLFVCDQAGDSKSKCEFDMLRCIYEKKFGYNITSAYEGRCCERLETCPVESKPVCDSTGVTHRNRCQFEVLRCRIEKIEKEQPPHVVSEGRCQDQPSTTPATTTAMATTDAIMIDSDQQSPAYPENTENQCAELTCVDKYAPVCGSNGKTYRSVCHLEKENCESEAEVSVTYFGECCLLDCPHNWSPVCDNEGTTHANLCEFSQQRCLAERIHHKNLTVHSYEECTGNADCGETCPDTYAPVCSTSGITFLNDCQMQRAKCHLNLAHGEVADIAKYYDGECCKTSPCDYAFAPICDTSGRTHINSCVFRQEQCIMERKFNKTVEKEYNGQCCNQPCEDKHEPVCDGSVTHQSICHFRVKQCEAERQGKVLSLAYMGECCKVPVGECEKSGALCDSEAHTHSDMCSFEAKKCIMERTNKTLTIVHSGECCTIDKCKNTDEPVCDNHGGTHASMCHFENTKCIYDKIHINSTLQFKYKGKCCENTCDDTWNPVCDQHGKLYTNKCHFLAKSCEVDRSTGGLLLQTPCSEQQARRRRIRSILQTISG